MVNEIALLGDMDDQFIVDVYNVLRNKGYQAVFLKFSDEEMPIRHRFKVLVDRASYCDNYLKGTYVISNPFTNTCDDKIIEFNICTKLGIPYPKTIILPKTNTEMDTKDQVSLPNLDLALSKLKFPIILKPHDGYAWDNVFMVNSIDEAKRIYDSNKDKMVLLAQEMINPRTFYRVYYFSRREPVFVKYIPSERRYTLSDYSDIKNVMHLMRDYTIKLNTALDYDFNACEWAVDQNDRIFLIDAFNETPELNSTIIPPDYYRTILERFVSLVEEKMHSFERNRWPFEYSP
jgi:hypothetical protein